MRTIQHEPRYGNAVTSYLKPKKDAFVGSHRKEDKLFRAFSLFTKDTLQSIIDVRVYYPGQTCYACVWVKSDDGWASGSDKAGGGGYDKISASVAYALNKMGFRFSRNFDGAGEETMCEALYAIGVHMGYPIDNLVLIKAHG